MNERIEHALGWHREDLSDFELRLVIRGQPFILKNSKQAVVKSIIPSKTGRGRRCPKCNTPLTVIPTLQPSKRASSYKTDAIAQLRVQWAALFRVPIPVDVELNAAIVSYRETRAHSDASNLYQMPEDALQAAGVIMDDFQIRTHNGSDREHDKENPRVEITLTPYLKVTLRHDYLIVGPKAVDK